MAALRRTMAALAGLAVLGTAFAQPSIPPEVAEKMAAAMKGGPKGDKGKDEMPPFDEVTKDYTKVVSTADGQASLYTIYTRDKDAQMLAELPRDFERQRLFIATTIASGIPTAGIQFGDTYAYWKRYDKRLALIEPNIAVRSTGDAESRSSRDQLFTDRVILDVPIVTMGPGGGPVIDMDELLVGQATKFFGRYAAGANGKLVRIAEAKAFPQNVELAFELPVQSGLLSTLHYSISVIPDKSGYQPRDADARIGFFTTTFRDLGKPERDDPFVRYVNRWDLEKADPSLKLSPPEEPIVFYLEHTTPVRYRRWVREGVEEWNKAFEKVGIVNAIEVYQQDARTGAHMEKDPEDVRYNFICWNSNGASFAIGPSRVDPRTGQILDADVVMNDGWIRAYALQYQRLLPELAMEGMGPETLAWLDRHPSWDPRIVMASPSDRPRLLQERARRIASGEDFLNLATPGPSGDPVLVGDNPFDGLAKRVSQVNGGCMMGMCMGMDLAMFRLDPDMFMAMAKGQDKPGAKDDKDKDKKNEDDLLDGVPETFIGPLIKDVIMHEVGHTLGLRHNFKASTYMSLEEMNSAGVAGKAQTASVMDYNPVNFNYKDGPVQGDWCMTTIGPYDYWAIEYGYSFDKDLKPILSRCSEPALAYGTDEETWGPDPRARRYDFGKDPLTFTESQMRLVQHLRSEILDRMVKDGQSWSKARDAYLTLLARQTNAIGVAANWVGGSFINRDMKGDPGNRSPIEDISPAEQRRALKIVIDNAFNDEAFGLTHDLLTKMTVDKWFDEGGFNRIFDDPTWPVHDRVMAIQAATLTMLMNPTTLRRVFDNEARVPDSEDTLTLPELMFTVTDSIWSELDKRSDKRFTAREPMISSLRRNLQRESLERLIDLTMPDKLSGAAAKPIATLAAYKLRDLDGRIKLVLDRADSKLDPYTTAHLSEARTRIQKALDAQYIYNTDAFSMGGSFVVQFGQTDATQPGR